MTPGIPALDPAAVLALAADEPGYDAGWWRGAVRGGLFAGSFGATVDAVRRLAGAAVPSPVHNGFVQSGAVLAALGAHEEVAALRSGARRYAFARTGPDGTDDVSTRAEGGRLYGTKCFVPYAASADVLLVVARTGVFAVERAAPGVRLEPIPTIGLDRSCAVHLDGAPATSLGTAPLETALARGVIALAADALGAAEAALRHAVERVTARPPLARRQAVRHRCADMLLDTTLTAGVVERAVRLVDDGAPDGEIRRAAAVAKAVASERCRRVTASAHQLGGGEGIHADQPLHLWYRRVKAAEPVLGAPRSHRAAIAAALLDPRPEGSG
ncbi:acyl-CoA dehydrogenase family protein [Cryptosporangium arvum]|uniref:acyl-CoA dehydrogenase family protein n=1 Tax=Cryptosporangium arvum TaxID=80871 RepID=UPI0004B9FB98|nr:acyl-CoA dehydrogenase family protein [Cryptosporangium arvum]